MRAEKIRRVDYLVVSYFNGIGWRSEVFKAPWLLQGDLAFLKKDVRITLKDERVKDKFVEFKFSGGVVSFVEFLNKNKNVLHKKVIYFAKEKDHIQAEVAMQYNDGYGENIFTFANNINTIEGGTHLTGFKSALTRTINQYCKSKNLLKRVTRRCPVTTSGRA